MAKHDFPSINPRWLLLMTFLSFMCQEMLSRMMLRTEVRRTSLIPRSSFMTSFPRRDKCLLHVPRSLPCSPHPSKGHQDVAFEPSRATSPSHQASSARKGASHRGHVPSLSKGPPRQGAEPAGDSIQEKPPRRRSQERQINQYPELGVEGAEGRARLPLPRLSSPSWLRGGLFQMLNTNPRSPLAETCRCPSHSFQKRSSARPKLLQNRSLPWVC